MNGVLALIYFKLLDDNKIKEINSRAFSALDKLTTVWLHGNICIDEDFATATRIADIARIVGESCGVAGKGRADQSLFRAAIVKILKNRFYISSSIEHRWDMRRS